MGTNEILERTGLDFNISKRPLFDVLDGTPVESGFYGIYNDRSGNCLCTTTGDYRVAQNKEIVDLVLQGVQGFDVDVNVQFGGSINDGKRIYLQLKVNGDGNVNGDKIVQYLTVIDSNDKSTSLSIGTGDLTMSCKNQFYKFYKAGQSKLRHSASLEEKLKEIPSLINLALNRSYKQIEIYNQFDKTSIHKDLVHQLVNNLMGVDRKMTPKEELELISTRKTNIMDKLYTSIYSEMEQKGETLWGLHSGITQFTTHEQSTPKRENGRQESLIFGNGYRFSQKSMDFCLEHL